MSPPRGQAGAAKAKKSGGKNTGKKAGKSAGPAFTVRVEAFAWVRTFLGGPADGSQAFSEAARPGDTVRSVLKALSSRYPKLDEALWDEHDRKEIGPHIEIIVNDTILGPDYTLDSPVSPGDEIILTGQYIGG